MKQALVTGASGGVGSLLTAALGRQGWSISGICRSLDKRSQALEQSASQEGWRLELKCCDLADPSALDALQPWLDHLAPNLDAFIHLAAPRINLQPIWRETASSYEKHWQVGAGAAFRICSSLLRPMAQKNNSHIIFLLSSVTLHPHAKGMASYTVGKYALLGLAHAISAEYHSRIAVSCISPSAMDTPFLHDLPETAKQLLANASSTGKFLPVESVVQQIINCLETHMPQTPLKNIAVT